MSIAFEQARWKYITIRVLENRIDHARRENACKQRSNRPAGPMHSECVERVVVAKSRFYFCDHPETKRSRNQADDKRRHRADESRSRRDCHKTCHRSGNCAERAGLSVSQPFCAAPADARGSRTEMRRDERARGKSAGCERAPCIESKPADPQQTRPDK